MKINKELNKQQKTWYVLNPAIILSDYLVEYEYSTEIYEEKKENTVNLEMRETKNKEATKILEKLYAALKFFRIHI